MYNLNLVAAQRLVNGEPLYDQAAARDEGIDLLGTDMAKTGKTLFSSYIGDPAVALTQVPFLPLGGEDGARVFRVLTFLEMIGAIILVAWSLSPPARAPAAVLALAALFVGFPMVKGLSLGQNNGLVMLSLAVGFYATARERWGLAGVGLGVATALKISPGLLVLHLLIRGERRAAQSACVTALTLVVAAAVVGRPDDVLVWVRDVSPRVSKGSVNVFNQSIVGAAARLTEAVPHFWSQAGAGRWYLVAYVLWGVAVYGRWRLRRGRDVDPLELAILVLVVLVAGPLSWDYYWVWAILPLVLLLDLDRWQGCRTLESCVLAGLLVVGVWCSRNGIPVPPTSLARDDWWQRVRTIRYLGTGVAYLGVAVWMLARPVDDGERRPDCSDGGSAPLGAPCEVVAGGVHRRG